MTSRDKKPPGGRSSLPIPWGLYLRLAVIAVIVGGAITFALHTANRINKNCVSLTEAAMSIRQEATTARLRLENIISGRSDTKIDVVWEHLDNADRAARTILEGGEADAPLLAISADPAVRSATEECRKAIADYRAAALAKFEASDRADEQIDKRYRDQFLILRQKAIDLKTTLEAAMERDLETFRYAQYALAALCLLLTLLAGVALHRFERRRGARALREEEQRHRSLFEDSPISLWEIDLSKTKEHAPAPGSAAKIKNKIASDRQAAIRVLKTIKIIGINKATLNLYEAASKEEFIKGLPALLTNETLAIFAEGLASLSGGKTTFEAETASRTLKGNPRHLAFRCSVAPGHEDSLSRVLVSTIDLTERRKVEEDLRIKEIAMASSISGISFTGVDRKISYINDSILKMWGYDDTSEVVGRSPSEFFVSPQEVEKNFAELIRDGIWIGEATARKKDGSPFTVQVAANIVTNSSGERIGAMASFLDITERKRMENALRESEERFRIAAENASDLIYEWNVATREMNWFGKIDEALGYQPGEFPRTTDAWNKAIHPDDYERADSVVQRHLKTREPYRDEYRVVRKNGEVRYWTDRGTAFWDEHGKPYKWIGVNTDITERKRAEEELRARTELLDAVLSNMTEGVTIENENHEIEYMNRAALEHYGDGVGIKCYEHYLSADKPCDECYVRDLLLNKTPSPLFQIRSMRPGLQLELITSVITRPDGRRVALSVGRDITERRRLEEQLFQAQKLQTLGTLAGGLAHDYNNLLVGVLGFASLIANDPTINARTRKYAAHIEQTAVRMADLTRQLLAFGRSGKWTLRLIDVNEAVEETLQILSQTVAQQIKIKTRLARKPCSVEGDPLQIGQVITNLCINAVEAMTGGGTLTVKTECAFFDKPAVKTIEQWHPGRYAHLAVSDTGSGMDQATVAKMFEPYFSTKGTGRGLGMAAVFGIVKNHHGWIAVDTEPGAGTTIHVYLPVAEKTAATPQADPGAAPSAAKENRGQ